MAMISSLVRVSRAPVGSSARMIGGLVDQRAGDGHALLLAAGELGGLVVRAVGQPDRFERRQGAPARRSPTPA